MGDVTTEGAVANADPSSGAIPPAILKEYETQYFGFTPKSFIDGVYNAMLDYLNDLVEITQGHLLSEKRFKDTVSEETIQESSERLYANLQHAFNCAFDRLEGYLFRNIFHIPSRVALPEDKIHSEVKYSEDKHQKLDLELEELRQKIRNTQYVNCTLEQWLKDIDITQHKLDSFLAQLQKWHVICRDANVPELNETLAFTAERTKRLLEQTKRLQDTKTLIKEQLDSHHGLSTRRLDSKGGT